MGVPREARPQSKMIEKTLDQRRHGFTDAERVGSSRIGKTDAQPWRDVAERNRRRGPRGTRAGDEDIERGAYSALTA